MHNKGFHYDIFIHVHNLFQSHSPSYSHHHILSCPPHTLTDPFLSLTHPLPLSYPMDFMEASHRSMGEDLFAEAQVPSQWLRNRRKSLSLSSTNPELQINSQGGLSPMIPDPYHDRLLIGSITCRPCAD